MAKRLIGVRIFAVGEEDELAVRGESLLPVLRMCADRLERPADRGTAAAHGVQLLNGVPNTWIHVVGGLTACVRDMGS